MLEFHKAVSSTCCSKLLHGHVDKLPSPESRPRLAPMTVVVGPLSCRRLSGSLRGLAFILSQSVRNSDQSDFIQPAIRKVMEDSKLDIGMVQP
ncbi:hypothetical protein HYDPIDRAFT_120460 [Hydnomerulius pinastri MD-312]|uniref:Uncharacterized protein n=1 Tax=Hydnomerulius pinastri MD-312 TaxID=994086 RepID=A0A0C9UXA3_9AGAM|nr:hypothetical protein HYDPIDRAFT_120460 [Hydnomerulius pinastri MD-312]